MLLQQLKNLRSNYRLILGSTSENRKKILTLSGLNSSDFEIMASNFAEDLPK